MRCLALLLALPLAALAQSAPDDSIRPPEPAREFRAVWVATVANMDWPSRPNLSTAEQQAELLAILDRAASLHMNAIVFQVRPEFDALYQSAIEPWSRFLTGFQGREPSPLWDPLAFAVDEAHRRGLELHAWLNPYRAAYWKDSLTAYGHVTQQRPDLIRPYYQFLWMDPGLADSRATVMRVVSDIVRRYDVDGIHIDDYFYPYPEVDRRGRTIEFPDAATYDGYRRDGGTLDKADWRRANVDQMVRELYATVKAEKPWVKVGISPFGIWRPGIPATTTAGLDQFAELYADVRKWLNEGWLDYLAPQLYWPVPGEQSYPVLLRWWVQENTRGREVWPGLALYKLPVTGPKHMSAADIVEEIQLTRLQPGARGHVLFNTRVLMNNVEGIADRLATLYADPALVPAMPWLDSLPAERPEASIVLDSLGTVVVRFAPGGAKPVSGWVVRARVSGAWLQAILPGRERTYILSAGEAAADVICVAAVDRVGKISPPVILRRTP